MRKKIIYGLMSAAALLAGTAADARGGTPDRVFYGDTLRARILFRQGDSDVDTAWCGNGSALIRFVDGVNALCADSLTVIHSVVVETCASPEGQFLNNDRLAMARARSIRKWLVDNLALNASQIKAYSSGIDWEGLVSAVRGSGSRWEQSVLDVISRYGVRTDYDRKLSEECLETLKLLDGGKAWNWMMKDIFPSLRRASGDISCIAYRDSNPVRDTVIISRRDTVMVALHGTAVDTASYMRVIEQKMQAAADARMKTYRNEDSLKVACTAIRTNLLVPLMNVGAELPLGNRWSVGADWYSPWVPRKLMNRVFDNYEECFQVQALTLTPRVWLGPTHSDVYGKDCHRLLGHSIGLVVAAAHYDVCFGYEGRQGDGLAVGLDYRFEFPLGKRGGIHMAVEAGAGYGVDLYRTYVAESSSGKLFGTNERFVRHAPVPLKAGLSLVVPVFGKGEKGGAR